ncbi:MAG: DUF748 domain-containing protein [Candidatus Rokuibacteriota bacterium]
MNRRLALRLAAAAAVLVALVAAVLIALPGIVRWLAVSRLAAATGRAVTLDAVDVELFRGRLGLRGLRVIDPDGSPLLTIQSADVRFSPRELAGGHLRIVDATVQAMAVRIVRIGPGEFNISDLLSPRAERAGALPAVTIERFALAGAVTIEDRTLTPARTWRVEAVELTARDASTVAGAPPGAATLSAVAAGAPISLAVTELRLAPLHFRAALDAREMDAALAALYLPPGSPLSPERGKVGVTATIEHDAATGTLVALEAGFTGVELHRPGQPGAYLSAPAVRVTVQGLRVRPGGVELARLAVDGGAITLEDTRLGPVRRWRVDGVALEARDLSSARDAPPGVATARAATTGARVEVWGTNVRLVPLELQATVIVRNVDLALFRLSLPPELPVHPERGVVNATIRVDHDGRRGTRLALDAGLSNIELRRPAHFVTAPAVRVTAAGIALDRGAVTVGRVNVVGERLTLEERTVTPVRTWPVRDLVFEARDLSSRRDAVQGVASLRATVAGAAASVFVTGARLDPLELRATTILRDLDAALLRLYIPSEVPVQLARGVINATFEVDTVAGGTRLTGDATLTGLQAQGRGALGTLAVTAPSLRVTVADGRHHGETLSVGRIELSGSGVLTDSRGTSARFDFAQMRVATEGLTWPVTAPARVEVSMRFRDRGELDGSGTARLTAPLPTIAWAAELGLQLKRVDLTPLAVYVPAARGLAGRVRADVTASLAYAGSLTARVRGDVGGARFALVEGGRTLLSLRSINATGLDLQWPQHMTIKQLRLRQPYALVTRDRQGAFPLATRFAAPPPEGETSPPAGAAPGPGNASPGPANGSGSSPLPTVEIAEAIVENGSAAFVDEGSTPPLRIDLPRVDLTARNVTWPASAPIDLVLNGTFPEGGTVKAEGSATVEPASVDVRVALQDAELAALQPYMGFQARIGGRLNATLAVAGPLSPAPRLKISGDAGLRSFSISDGSRPVITAQGLRVTGIDAEWPTRIAFDRVGVQRSWALLERDSQGRFLLRTLLGRPAGVGAPRPAGTDAPPADAGAPRPAAPAPTAGSTFELSFREGVFAGQSATIIDGVTTPPARIDVADARLTVRDFTWPSRGPAKVELTSPMPGGGRLDAAGTIDLEPLRLEGRATLDGVAIEPTQPYLPIEGRVAGKVTGDLTVKLALEPFTVQVGGRVRLRAFRLNHGERAVMTVGRVDTTGIDVDWPTRIALQRVQFRRPRLLIERDASGQILLRRLVTPHWGTTAPAPSVPPGPAPAASTAPGRPPAIEIGTLSLERASARFVDRTTTPAYAEELEDLNVTFAPLTTVPGRPTRVAASGVIGGGSFKLHGEGAYGEHPALDLKTELRSFVVPRANPYLDRYTAWIATNGSLDVTSTYTVAGTRLDTRHDLVVRDLEVAPTDARDEVEQRIGLPFGLLVSLLKDSRSEIRLTLPVSGDLRTREFDYREAVWGAVRNLAIRLLALPFSKIGSLSFSEDSRVKAVALAPVVFEAGTARLGPGMEPHLARVADFLRGAPSMKVVLEPVLVEADVQALERDTAATQPADALRTLATRRLDVVRQGLTGGGGIDVARLGGRARRTPLVEAAGDARVEFDLRP